MVQAMTFMFSYTTKNDSVWVQCFFMEVNPGCHKWLLSILVPDSQEEVLIKPSKKQRNFLPAILERLLAQVKIACWFLYDFVWCQALSPWNWKIHFKNFMPEVSLLHWVCLSFFQYSCSISRGFVSYFQNVIDNIVAISRQHFGNNVRFM